MNLVSYPPPAPTPQYYHQMYPNHPVQPAQAQQNIRLPSIQELLPDSVLAASKRPAPPKLNTYHPQQQQQHSHMLMSPPVSQASSPNTSHMSGSAFPPTYQQSQVPPFNHLPSPPPTHQPIHHHHYQHHAHHEPSSPPRNQAKKRRGNLPRQVTDILRTWLHEHIQHPYPTESEKNELMQRTGLTLNQISNWFINARRRRLPALNKNREKQRMYSNL